MGVMVEESKARGLIKQTWILNKMFFIVNQNGEYPLELYQSNNSTFYFCVKYSFCIATLVAWRNALYSFQSPMANFQHISSITKNK